MIENCAYVMLHPDTMALVIPSYLRFLPVVRDRQVPVGMVWRIDPRLTQDLYMEEFHARRGGAGGGAPAAG